MMSDTDMSSCRTTAVHGQAHLGFPKTSRNGAYASSRQLQAGRQARGEEKAMINLKVVRNMLLFAGMVCMLFSTVTAWAAARTYVGVEACALCHEKQYSIWKTSAHAKAYLDLGAGAQKDPRCLSCHTTGGTAAFPNVQCEACHGPGSEYSDMETMKNFRKVWDAGLNRQAAGTCVNCHNENSPTYRGFDFKASWMEIMH